MPVVADAVAQLERIAPPGLAEEWDNVGLLLGDAAAPLERLMTCLTLTAEVASEAIRRRASLVVAHHPLPFRPLRRLSTDSADGALVWSLASAGIALYSAHTAYDSAPGGCNDQLARLLGLGDVVALQPSPLGGGAGRIGRTHQAETVAGLAGRLRDTLGAPLVRSTAPPGRAARRVAVACGSGASLLDAAVAAGADLVVTGEASMHECLRAEALAAPLLLVGHYHSERFAIESLAERLAGLLPGVEAWPSGDEQDPLGVV